MAPPTLAEDLGKKKPFDLPEREAMLGVLRTAAVLAEPFERLFRDAGLSMPLFNILRILGSRGRAGIASGEIGPQMVTPAPDVTRLVDRLVKAGLVCRDRDESDRRVVRVAITDSGKRLLKKLNPAVTRLHKQTLGRLGAEDLREINRLMEKARAVAEPPEKEN